MFMQNKINERDTMTKHCVIPWDIERKVNSISKGESLHSKGSRNPSSDKVRLIIVEDFFYFPFLVVAVAEQ